MRDFVEKRLKHDIYIFFSMSITVHLWSVVTCSNETESVGKKVSLSISPVWNLSAMRTFFKQRYNRQFYCLDSSNGNLCNERNHQRTTEGSRQHFLWLQSINGVTNCKLRWVAERWPEAPKDRVVPRKGVEMLTKNYCC